MAASSYEINLDAEGDALTKTSTGAAAESLLDRAAAEGVENDKCVIAAYRTSAAQAATLRKHLQGCDKSEVPVEWVIDIADESNGWFYGTAYHYNDKTMMLHVMVPDKLNPVFDGFVPLDHRTVHLIECVDKTTDALFNKIVRDSVVKVRWEVEWFEEGEGAESQGRWIKSTARFLVRIANQLLVEDENFGQESKGFVMLTADLNLRLLKCVKGKGADDFKRLITESVVQVAPDALESLKDAEGAPETETDKPVAEPPSPSFKGSSDLLAPLSKLSDMSKSLREHFADIMDERDRIIEEKQTMADKFTRFVLEGDLDLGLALMDSSDAVLREKHSRAQKQADGYVEDAWSMANRLERGLTKVVRSGKRGGAPEGEPGKERRR